MGADNSSYIPVCCSFPAAFKKPGNIFGLFVLMYTSLCILENLIFRDEETVFTIYPELQAVKDELYNEGAIYASMSGSGSTLFGIFENEPEKKFLDNTNVLEIIVKL